MNIIPDSNAHFGSLYVIEIGRSRIKVGYSTNPADRMAGHRSMAEAHGCKPGRQWMSPRGLGTFEGEVQLIAFCAQRARAQFRHEYFTGVPFTAAVRYAAELCGDTETLAGLVEAERSARLALFDEATRCGDGPPRALGSFEEAVRWLRVSKAEFHELVLASVLPVVTMGNTKHISVAAMRGHLERQSQDQEPVKHP